MNKKFVGLIILDGFGLSETEYGNAISQANPTNLKQYFKNYPFTTLQASGESVGLPKGQFGNSEVGHLNIGNGNIVMQTLQKINNSIKTGAFFENSELLQAVKHVKQNNSALHIIGLTSPGGVHSHINHLFALIDFAKQQEVQKVYIHVFTDGRDTLRNAGVEYVKQLQERLQGTNFKIASVMGRFYAMDRDKNYDRTQKAYDAMVFGTSLITNENVVAAIENSYEEGVYDEFIKPVVITQNNKPIATIQEDDAVVFYNYREDRARQITDALVEKGFSQFKTKNLKNVYMVTFNRYDDSFQNIHVAFEKDLLNENLSEVISKNGLKQFKIAETTKYAHVTYFLNGGIEKPYENEDRYLIETIKTENFEEVPQMRAVEITDKALERIATKQYDLMVLNYSNCDMIGHTGDINAAIKAVKVIDEQVKRLVDSILAIDGIALLTADHGNAEQMLDEKGNVLTDHTTNLVPFVVVGNHVQDMKLKQGCVLSNITPTILQLLGVKKPDTFQQESIIKK